MRGLVCVPCMTVRFGDLETRPSAYRGFASDRQVSGHANQSLRFLSASFRKDCRSGAYRRHRLRRVGG
jgi:hypothetical protein